MNRFITKMLKKLVKTEKYIVEKWIGKDDLEYEDYLCTIKKHEKELNRISKESKM